MESNFNATIWKYELNKNDTTVLRIPKKNKVISVANQGNKLVLYAIVDPTSQIEAVIIDVIPTGELLNDNVFNTEFIGTVSTHDGDLIWHVFKH